MNSNNVALVARKLYILSAPPGVGKSTFTKNVREFVVSSDSLRNQVLGGWEDSGKVKLYPHRDAEVFSILHTIVEARAKERLTTIVDATSVDEKSRNELAALATKHGQKVEVLILDLPIEMAKLRNKLRPETLPDKAIEAFYAKFQKTSALPFRVVNMENSVFAEVVPDAIPNDVELDVIGDVHGMYPELVQLLAKLGYAVNSGTPVHPANRKLLFLGDMVDRGPNSIEVLRLVKKAVEAGHYALLGNHETKLIRFWKSRNTGTAAKLSFSAAETAMAFAKLDTAEQATLGQFLDGLPVTLSWRGYGFAHANLVHYDPITTPASELLFGYDARSKISSDTDAEYAKLALRGVNRYVLLRGHILPTGDGNGAVVSLEAEQAFAGNLRALRLPEYHAEREKAGHEAALASATVDVKCYFNFNEVAAPNLARLKRLKELVAKKYVISSAAEGGTLTLWKYSNQVFFDSLWSSDPMLLKARGLVTDIAGNVVAHPFDKVFNYKEEGAGMSLDGDAPVIKVVKQNGFLGVVSHNPFENKLLTTTTGSFDSKYIGYVNEYLPGPVKGKILQHFYHQGALSLMFEVIHPEDPHIISYTQEMYGLWLIGARRLDWEHKAMTEPELDALAEKLGLRRPAWETTTLNKVKAEMGSVRHEGYMLRQTNADQDFICKIKSPYYLSAKFLARLTPKKVRLMFANPGVFKKQVDEEFYFLVDEVVRSFPLAVFEAMPEQDRLAMVRVKVAQYFGY